MGQRTQAWLRSSPEKPVLAGHRAQQIAPVSPCRSVRPSADTGGRRTSGGSGGRLRWGVFNAPAPTLREFSLPPSQEQGSSPNNMAPGTPQRSGRIWRMHSGGSLQSRTRREKRERGSIIRASSAAWGERRDR
ncbi:Piso0_004861 [Millerozyma farinosa CBS 7064]|uniref:Piso0_004861 protein n=1 Tax=Pichia sorbitophila (strain ATCC MYA-4447 / BCRC 22081 / CBS 7064 / NBRC 10061 / NRRL Y-12695) TaxID=559304 RepID=G8Y3L0_PICSO|nr:Piso0_004861 [Millerozyma farinosa CBS 7064]